MQRMVEYKYYLSINNAIDRSTCYETAGEARRAAKSVKAEKVMIVVEKFTREFLKHKNKLEKTKIKSERIGCL